MNTFYLPVYLLTFLGLTGCAPLKSKEKSPQRPRRVENPSDNHNLRTVATIEIRNEFFVDVMPLSDGRSFEPSFQVTHKTGDNFSTENYDELIRYYRKSPFSGAQRILLKSNHHLVLWNATDRKMARGTVLQERHFSSEWKSYRDEERVFIDRFIQTASKERIEVWINESMNVANGTWRLMTPPVQADVRGNVVSLSKKVPEIKAELNKVFHEARRSERLPGMHPDANGTADVVIPGSSRNLERYPQQAEIRVSLEDSEDLLEYHYEKKTPAASWKLEHAWRVHGEGQRTRLKTTK